MLWRLVGNVAPDEGEEAALDKDSMELGVLVVLGVLGTCCL